MGLVINPTAFRIGYVRAWTDAWYLHRMHYPVFVHKSLEIKALLQYILLRCYPGQWSHWIYSHATYYYLGNKFQVSLFVYDGNDPYQYLRFSKNHKFGWFRKSKFLKFWTKKQLLDLQFFYQRWFLLCQAMNFDFESLTLDSLSWRVNKRHLRKMEGLRRKYGRFWVAREELFMWKFPINMTSDSSYNKMGMTILNKLYKMFIMPRIKASFSRSDLTLVNSAYTVLRSYKIFYFFFSYIDKILKYIPTYPIGLFNRLTYKACYRFFRMYFIYKPYWLNLSKLYELILLFININSKVKVYILDNSHLNASYLARYIITCLRAKFDYRDTMIPIKKTLLKIMLAKRWRPIKDVKKKSWSVYLERYKSLMKDRVYFHLINSDIVKMFFVKFRLLLKVKRISAKRKLWKKFKILNFSALKRTLSFIKNFFFIKDNVLFKFKKINFFLNLKKTKIIRFRLLGLIFKNFYIKKFIFLKKNKIKKNLKNNFNKFKIKKNYWMYWKKRIYISINTYIQQLYRYILLKKLIFSVFLNKHKRDYERNFNKFFYIKLRRLYLKSQMWIYIKKYIRHGLNKSYIAKYRRVNKINPKLNLNNFKGALRWIAVKKWFSRRNRKSFFLPSKKKFNVTGILTVNEDKLDSILFKIKKKIINFSVIYDKMYNFYEINILLKNKIIVNFQLLLNWFFYNKSFFPKRLKILKKKFFIRNQFNLFFFNFLNRYINIFKPFAFQIDLYRNYISNVLNLSDVNSQFIAKKPKKYELEEMPLKDKFKRLRTLEGGSKSLLYGYKFHFVGRFTRKQKAASLWFAKGANSVSSMRVDVDYGFHTIALRYSACTLKVWLYRNRGYSYKFGYRLV